jgi:REP element-mobilizing transposase RayT
MPNNRSTMIPEAVAPGYGGVAGQLITDMKFFNPEENVTKYRGALPHWRQVGVTYFVTFRQADSLPTAKLEALQEEKRIWKQVNPGPLSDAQKKEYAVRFSGKIQDWLDAGYGRCALAASEVREMMENTLQYFANKRYELGEFVVMPNHVHVLVTPIYDFRLEKILRSWKPFSAKRINEICGSSGQVWHRESFDHIVRNKEQLRRIEQYIRDNPKKAGLR